MKLPNIYLLFVAIASVSCSEKDLLPGFNSEAWKNDENGCLGERTSLVDDIINRKSELTSLGQEDIVSVLGKPDRHELYSRNKKAFVYFVLAGPGCQDTAQESAYLTIRFDGLGRAKTIIYHQTNQE